jgi:hypothetical protein
MLVVDGAPVTEPTLVYSQVMYAVVPSESGLPTGTSWSVTLNGTMEGSTNSTITFAEPNGTYAYVVGAVAGYTASPASGSATVNGGAIGVNVTFTQVTYVVTISEAGLPSGTFWSVALNGAMKNSTNSTIVFAEPNGTYGYTVGAVNGYTASPPSGSVTLDGAPAGVSVTFTQVTYKVTFTEAGLPLGTSWSVTLNGGMQSSTGSAITFTEPNGKYAYTVGTVAGYTASPSSGSATVNGSGENVSTTFTPSSIATYAVTFTETGLPVGTNWSVTLDGLTRSSVTAAITFTEGNGSFSYSVGAVVDYASNPSNGTLTVNGGPLSVALTLTRVYSITFTEYGLPSGSNWSVTLTGGSSSVILFSSLASGSVPVTVWSDGASTVLFQVSSGTYAYSASAPGYGSTPGNVIVTGDGMAPVMLHFTLSSSSSSGLDPFAYLTIGLVVVVVAVALGIALILMFRPRKTPSAPERSPPRPGEGVPPAPP